jgi:hypothetical protein
MNRNKQNNNPMLMMNSNINNQNPYMMSNNPHTNPNTNTNSNNINNQQLYLQQLQKMQQMNPNMNSNMNNNNNMNNRNNMNIQLRNTDNIELISNIKQIMQLPNQDEKKELLGETIFYFLLGFIPSFNLNLTNGKFSDDVLCSKLTGIFLHTDEKELLEILSNTEILVLTIKDVIMVIIYI